MARKSSRVAKIPVSVYSGIGIYSAVQAAAWIHASPADVRRWLVGYRDYAPLWKPQLPPDDGQLRLGFLDLMELRFVREFRRHGVSLQHIRAVISKARELIRTDHPLSTRRFKTDGRDILAEVAKQTGDTGLLNLRNEQWGIVAAIEPSIVADVVFSNDDTAREWWPLGRDNEIVIDPRRSFGQPIIAKYGVLTRLVARTVRAEGGDVARAAHALDVPVPMAEYALRFEQSFAA